MTNAKLRSIAWAALFISISHLLLATSLFFPLKPTLAIVGFIGVLSIFISGMVVSSHLKTETGKLRGKSKLGVLCIGISFLILIDPTRTIAMTGPIGPDNLLIARTAITMMFGYLLASTGSYLLLKSYASAGENKASRVGIYMQIATCIVLVLAIAFSRSSFMDFLPLTLLGYFISNVFLGLNGIVIASNLFLPGPPLRDSIPNNPHYRTAGVTASQTFATPAAKEPSSQQIIVPVSSDEKNPTAELSSSPGEHRPRTTLSPALAQKLDERLISGEISEETYLILLKKYGLDRGIDTSANNA